MTKRQTQKQILKILASPVLTTADINQLHILLGCTKSVPTYSADDRNTLTALRVTILALAKQIRNN